MIPSLVFALLAAGAPSPDHATHVVETYVDHVRHGRLQDAVSMHDAALAGALPAARLGAVLAQVTGGRRLVGPCTRTRVETRPAGLSVTCTARVGATVKDVRVALDDGARVSGLAFLDSADALPPPPYVDASAFVEQDVTLAVGRFTLPGTLTLPVRGGPFPAVLLLPGAGALDRDGTTGPNRPLRDLAHGLASRGVLVLRMDKRNLVYGSDISDTPGVFTVEDEVVEDAAAAVRMLKARGDVSGVVLVGQGLGAGVAPRVALRAGGVSGLVLVGGNISPLHERLLRELAQLEKRGGPRGARAARDRPAVEHAARRMAALVPRDRADPSPILGAPAAYHLDMAAHHPAHAVRALAVPTLVVGLGRDFHAPPSEMDLWRRALVDAPGVAFKTFAPLNHVMAPGTGPADPDEHARPGHVDGTLVEAVAAHVHGSITGVRTGLAL